MCTRAYLASEGLVQNNCFIAFDGVINGKRKNKILTLSIPVDKLPREFMNVMNYACTIIIINYIPTTTTTGYEI